MRSNGSFLDTGYVPCSETGKRGYYTRRAARAARTRTHSPALGIYICVHCGLYHIGHMPKGQSRKTLRATSTER